MVNNIWTYFLPSLLSPSVTPLRGRPSSALGARAPPSGGGLGAAGQHQSGGLSCQLCPAPPTFSSVSPAQGWSWWLHFILCPIPSSVTFWCSLLGDTELPLRKVSTAGSLWSVRWVSFWPSHMGTRLKLQPCRATGQMVGVWKAFSRRGAQSRHLTESWYLSVQGCRRQACLLGWDCWALKNSGYI